MTEQATEPTSAEVETTTEEPVEPTTTTTKEVSSDLLNSDAFVNKVADAVFDRVKNFSQTLVDTAQQAAQIAQDMVPIEGPPPEGGEESVEQAPPPDTGPQRRHGLFSQPFKRNQ